MAAINNKEADEIFHQIIESDRLVFFTGAGFSADIKNKYGKIFPGWKELLTIIYKARKAANKLTAADSKFFKLFHNSNEGSSLIQAASILRNGFENEFDQVVDGNFTAASVKKQNKQQLAAHIAKQNMLLSFFPKGIVTTNVDTLHELSLRRNKLTSVWNIGNPLSADPNLGLNKVLAEISEKPFLIKAHGSSNDKMAFAFETYLQLLRSTPEYVAFMQNLFSRFQIIFIGFGLTDLDFDFFLLSLVLTFGKPLHPHIALVKHSTDTRILEKAALLKLRYGIVIKWYADHGDIITILDDARRKPGKKLRRILEDCLAADRPLRSRAHIEIANLGKIGKHIAILYILDNLKQMRANNSRNWSKQSELIYTLGKVKSSVNSDKQECRKVLLDILEETNYKEVAAHTVIALEEYATTKDIGRLKRLQKNDSYWKKLKGDGAATTDLKNRTPVYLHALILKLQSKL